MARVLEALYENGVFRPLEDPGLNEHARVVLEIKEKTEDQRPERPKQRVFGSAKGLIKYMSDDFDEPLEDFAEYM